jgi:anti-sigma B factor antagonist
VNRLYPLLVHVQVERTGDTICIVVSGEIDLATAADLKEAGLRALADPACRSLILDLSEVAFMDSTGLGSLVDLRNAARSEQSPIRLHHPSPRVLEVLKLTSMDNVFEIAHADPS